MIEYMDMMKREGPTAGPKREPLENIEEALKLATKYRALVIKTFGVEVHMSPLAFALPEEPLPSGQTVGAEHGNPTDEELLLWSAGGPLPSPDTTPPGAPPGES